MSNQKNLNKYISELISEVERELDEETTSGDAAGYDTPNAFGDNSEKSKKKTKDVSTQAGYEVIDGDVRNISESNIPKPIQSMIDDMVSNKIQRKTIKVNQSSPGWKRFLKDVKPALQDKLLIVKPNPINSNEVWISLGPNSQNKISESFWPQSKFSDTFNGLLDRELKKLKGFWYVKGYDLYKHSGNGNDQLITKINPRNDSIESIMKRVKQTESVNESELYGQIAADSIDSIIKKLSYYKIHLSQNPNKNWYNIVAQDSKNLPKVQRILKDLYGIKTHIKNNGMSKYIEFYGDQLLEDKIQGGLSQGMTLKDIANKHNVDIQELIEQFKKGIKVEMEHTTDVEISKEITLDHLFEDPKYYDKLATIETESVTMNNLDWGKTTAERNSNLDIYKTLKTRKEVDDFLRKLKSTNKSVNEVSNISLRRAKAELKQKIKGVRSDGMGKYTGKILAIKGHEKIELKSLNDFNKYSNGYTWGLSESQGDMRNNAKGAITGGTRVDIEIKQQGNTREYDVFVNKKKIGSIKNLSNWDNRGVSSLLSSTAERLAQDKNLIPKYSAVRIGFIGNPKHVQNESMNNDFFDSKAKRIERGNVYLFRMGKTKTVIKIKEVDPNKGLKYFDFKDKETYFVPNSTWNSKKYGHYMTRAHHVTESINEVSTLGLSGVKSFAKKHGFSVKTKSSRNNDRITISKDGKVYGTVDPSITTQKSLSKLLNVTISENRWLAIKNEDTHPHKKLAMGLKELKNQLTEVEKFFGWYNKIKNINELDSDNYWKRTNTHIGKIKERIVNIARTLQELEK